MEKTKIGNYVSSVFFVYNFVIKVFVIKVQRFCFCY